MTVDRVAAARQLVRLVGVDVVREWAATVDAARLQAAADGVTLELPLVVVFALVEMSATLVADPGADVADSGDSMLTVPEIERRFGQPQRTTRWAIKNGHLTARDRERGKGYVVAERDLRQWLARRKGA